ncbi:MAG TPA: hypothetical protein VGF33_08510 [Caulobacteraceae bacterium]|jgi:hypothetical protein
MKLPGIALATLAITALVGGTAAAQVTMQPIPNPPEKARPMAKGRHHGRRHHQHTHMHRHYHVHYHAHHHMKAAPEATPDTGAAPSTPQQ